MCLILLFTGKFTRSTQRQPLLHVSGSEKHLGLQPPSSAIANRPSLAVGGPDQVLVLHNGSHDQTTHVRHILGLLLRGVRPIREV